MSQGLSFLRACCEAGAQLAFRHALPIWFSQEETPIYQFVLQHLSRHGRLPSITTLREQGIGLPNAPEPPEFYAARLRDRAITTQIQHFHPSLIEGLKRMDPALMLQSANAMVRAANAVAPTLGMTSFAEQAGLVLDAHDFARLRTGLLGVTLGWEVIDLLTDGGQPGDVIVLVGRPGLGKTYMMLHQMRQAWLAGHSVFIASMEMSSMQIARRLLGMHGGVNPSLIRSGRLSTQSYRQIVEMVDNLDDMPPIHIMTGSFRKSVNDVDRALQELTPDAAYIDAGYLATTAKKSNSRHEQIADVIEDFKGVAIDRNIPLTTTVQFSRQVKRRQRGAPELGDIGGSDAIAQVASIVLGARYGVAPYERQTRILSLIKNREGDEVEYVIDFALNPPNFAFRNIHIEGEDDDNPATDMSSMAIST